MVSPAGADLREENVHFWCQLPSSLQAEMFLLTFLTPQEVGFLSFDLWNV